MIKHPFIHRCIGLVLISAPTLTSAQTIDSVELNVGYVLELYETLSEKKLGKASAYRLIATKGMNNGEALDSNRIYYSGERGSRLIPATIIQNNMETRYGFYETLYDSVVKYQSDVHNNFYRSDFFYHKFNSQGQVEEYGIHYYGTMRNRTRYKYDSDGKLLTVSFDTYASGAWKHVSRSHYVHQASRFTHFELKWNNNPTWDTLIRNEHILNPEGMTDSMVRYSKNGIWRLEAAEAYDYDSGKRQIRFTTYTYKMSISALKMQASQTTSYTSRGDIEETISYNNFGGDTSVTKTSYYYSAGARLDSIVGYVRDTGNTVWVPMTKCMFSYSFGLLNKKEQYQFDSMVFIPVDKLEFTSDANQNIETATYFKWSEADQSYKRGLDYRYYYEEYEGPDVGLKEAGDGTFGIYPNPGKGHFAVVMPFEGSASLQVFGIDGRQVHQAVLSGSKGETREFDLSVPAGVYFFRIIGKGQETKTGKVVVSGL